MVYGVFKRLYGSGVRPIRNLRWALVPLAVHVEEAGKTQTRRIIRMVAGCILTGSRDLNVNSYARSPQPNRHRSGT
jgi:hypothetical protein